jgi:hypothetical protein
VIVMYMRVWKSTHAFIITDVSLAM